MFTVEGTVVDAEGTCTCGATTYVGCRCGITAEQWAAAFSAAFGGLAAVLKITKQP